MSIPSNPDATALATLAAHNDAVAGTYIGEAIWPSFFKAQIPHTVVKQAFADANLDTYTPKLSSPPDVFHRVCRMELKQTIHLEDGTRVRISTVKIADTSLEVARRVVVEHLDPKGGRLWHGQSWDLRFAKGSFKLDMFPITVDVNGTVSSRDRHADPAPGDDMLSGIPDAYAAAVSCVDNDALARACTNALDDAKAVPLRPGGIVYYVPFEYRHVVDGLKEIAGKLEGMAVGGVAVTDSAEQRSAITAGATERTVAEASRLITELREAKAGKTIGTRRMRTLVAEHRTIKERLARYQELLANNLDTADTQVEILSRLLASVLDKPAADEASADAA